MMCVRRFSAEPALREGNTILCVKGRKFNLFLKNVVRSEERKGLQRARRQMNQIV